jgi:hypothetical protein
VRYSGVRVRLMNPGPAISGGRQRPPVSRCSTIRAATSRGFCFSWRARPIAALHW